MKPSIVPTVDEAPRARLGTALQQLGRRLFLAKLAGLREGELTVIEGGESFTCGRRTPECNLRATIEVLHRRPTPTRRSAAPWAPARPTSAACGAPTISRR